MKTQTLFKTFTLALLFLLISCQQDDSSEIDSTAYSTNQETILPERAYKGGPLELVTIKLNGKSVVAQKIDGQYIIEGDIIVEPDELNYSAKSVGINAPLRKWPNNTVYYDIDSELHPHTKQSIKDAIAHWESKTALRFVPRTNEEHYVLFKLGNSCSSSFGYNRRGFQIITLDTFCSLGNVIHEIGHTIGLFHEHTRRDRDQFVNIHYENMVTGAETQYRFFTEWHRSGQEYTEMDFNSVMMYDSYAFSRSGRATMTRLDGRRFTGGDSLSDLDIKGVYTMYPDPGLPFLRYYNPDSGDHFYTTNDDEFVNGTRGYVSERTPGRLFLSNKPGTIPFYRYYNPSNGDQVYTSNFSELGEGKGGYLYEGISGYVYPNRADSTIPLYRYYHPEKEDHFYTSNFFEIEFQENRGGYLYEGIAGYVLPR